MTKTRFSALALAATACLTAGAAAPSAPTSGGSLDIIAGGIIPIQTIPGVTLLAGKPTFVRTVFFTTGTVPAGTMVDGLLRVYVDGVEAPYSPIFSTNGPIEPTNTPNQNSIDDSLNFIFLPPESNDVVLEVEINPTGPGQVCETDFSNNINTSPSITFECVQKPDLVYVPIDYRPGGGGTPNVANADLIDPGVGDNFIQGMYPAGDWDYRRSVPPTKLWTGNLNGSGSALNSSLAADRAMMVPIPDKIYGWVPGSLPYNGQALGIPGVAGMGNTQQIRHQRTFAHEIGHLYGRSHINNQTQVVGVDVEHHLAITQGLSQLKPGNLNDVMVAGLLTNQAWVYAINHEFYVNHPDFSCTEDAPLAYHDEPTYLIGGVWNRATDDVSITQSVTFNGGFGSETVALSEANLVFTAFDENGAVLGRFGQLIRTANDCSSEESHEHESEADAWEHNDPNAGFLMVFPASIDPALIERVEISGGDGVVKTEMVRSPSKPFVELSPTTPANVNGSSLLLDWDVSDADGNEVKHYLRYSPDGEQIHVLTSNWTQSSYGVDMSVLPAFVEGQGYFEVLATDGLNTTRLVIDDLTFGAESSGNNPPETHILSPDANTTFLEGAPVILHSSGWDIEDLAIEGSDLVWTSNVDGVLGTGRLLIVSDLSVGAHLITVTANDTAGAIDTDQAAIIITGRTLPSTVVCQTDFGFGGPGSSLLEICGGDLSSGTSADVKLSNALPNVNVWAISGDIANPTAAIGGTLVPVPILDILPGMTDGAGEWLLPGIIAGGGGPFTFYVQSAYLDASQPAGFGISNAVEVQILP